MNGIRWTEQEYQAYLDRQDCPAIPIAKPQPSEQLKLEKKNMAQEVHPRFRIVIHQRRRRLIDPDNAYAKPAIDGLVVGGLLPDDGPSWVESVTFTQEKIKAWERQQTIIEIWRLDGPRIRKKCN